MNRPSVAAALAATFLVAALLPLVPTTTAGVPERCVTKDGTTTCLWFTECPVSVHPSDDGGYGYGEYCLTANPACPIEYQYTHPTDSRTDCVAGNGSRAAAPTVGNCVTPVDAKDFRVSLCHNLQGPCVLTLSSTTKAGTTTVCVDPAALLGVEMQDPCVNGPSGPDAVVMWCLHPTNPDCLVSQHIATHEGYVSSICLVDANPRGAAASTPDTSGPTCISSPRQGEFQQSWCVDATGSCQVTHTMATGPGGFQDAYCVDPASPCPVMHYYDRLGEWGADCVVGSDDGSTAAAAGPGVTGCHTLAQGFDFYRGICIWVGRDCTVYYQAYNKDDDQSMCLVPDPTMVRPAAAGPDPTGDQVRVGPCLVGWSLFPDTEHVAVNCGVASAFVFAGFGGPDCGATIAGKTVAPCDRPWTARAAGPDLTRRTVTVGPCAAGYSLFPDNSGVFAGCPGIAGVRYWSTMLGPSCAVTVLTTTTDPCADAWGGERAASASVGEPQKVCQLVWTGPDIMVSYCVNPKGPCYVSQEGYWPSGSAYECYVERPGVNVQVEKQCTPPIVGPDIWITYCLDAQGECVFGLEGYHPQCYVERPLAQRAAGPGLEEQCTTWTQVGDSWFMMCVDPEGLCMVEGYGAATGCYVARPTPALP